MVVLGWKEEPPFVYCYEDLCLSPLASPEESSCIGFCHHKPWAVTMLPIEWFCSL